jgi:hypothetical protein
MSEELKTDVDILKTRFENLKWQKISENNKICADIEILKTQLTNLQNEHQQLKIDYSILQRFSKKKRNVHKH